MLSKFADKSAQKSSIFSIKAGFKKSLFILLLILAQNTIYGEDKLPASYCIASEIKRGLESCESKHIELFIQGMEACTNGVRLTNEEHKIMTIRAEKQKAFLSELNLLESEKWLKKISSQAISSIIPEKLLYKCLREGKGRTVNNQNGKIIVNFSIKSFNELLPLISERKATLTLSETILGLAHGMLGMQEGEIRKIYIHPDYAYGSQTNFNPNTALEVIVEVLSILPEYSEIPPLLELASNKPISVSQIELEELSLKNSYVIGWKLWKHLKWGYNLFSKEELITELRKNDEKLPISSVDLNRELNRIHWKIYHQKIKDETATTPAFFAQIALQDNVKCLVPNHIYYKALSINDSPQYQPSYKVKYVLKDRKGEILQAERLEVIDCDNTVPGFKESLPYLVPGISTTLYIHPKWAFPGIDKPYGDLLLTVEIERIKE